ncbi:MAG: succinylglutamate desuccinylase/aspartoacylase family protein [Planctomycetaceae bacterium]|nr:succinylglutamate desuccinylase/aspartoacylase family protein [Planctomycetaceae bacterium]
MTKQSARPSRKSPHVWGDIKILPGQSAEVSLAVTESYSSLTIPIPIVVQRGSEEGPVGFITAALHGDEINGTGIIRSLIRDQQLHLLRGTLILVPVLNILGFERHSRYLPDRRDLNRCFPGSMRGSLAHRMAKIIFEEIVARCDFGIDLHTAAVRRTNFPNVRAEMTNPKVAQLAESFGCEVILDSKGPPGSLRREATARGCPVIILEAGEIWKVEPAVVDFGVKGILSLLSGQGMIEQATPPPAYRLILDHTQWIRASKGGFLRFHVSPGDLVRKGAPLATYTTLTGKETGVINAPHHAMVLGMTTLPCITPGDPICHLGMIPDRFEEVQQLRAEAADDNLHDRLIKDLSTNVRVVEPSESRP